MTELWIETGGIPWFMHIDFWNLTKFDLNLSQKASKEDGFLQRYLSL